MNKTARTLAVMVGSTARRGLVACACERDVYYLEQPGGGDFQIAVRGHEPARVSTRDDAKVSRKASVAVPDGGASMTITLGGATFARSASLMERP